MRAYLVTLQDAAVATGNGTAMLATGYASIAYQVSGTFVGTVTFEGTVDNTNWVAIQAVNTATGAVSTTATAGGVYVANVAGLSQARARVTWTSGTSVTVKGQAVDAGSLNLADVDVQASEDVTISNAITAGVYTRPGNNIPDTTYIGDIKFGEALVAGENHMGQVGGEGLRISQTPTVTAGAYSANDAVGGLLTFANAARVSAGSGIIKDVILIDDAGQDVALELWLFNQTFTNMSDNAAWAPSEADLRNLVAIISSGDGAWRAAGTPSVNNIEVARAYNLTGTSLFGQLVTRGTPTFAATDDVTVIVQVMQD